MAAMPGWFRLARTWASRWNRARRSGSLANASGRILRATCRFSLVSVAWYTRLRVGRSLPQLQDDVRLLRWPPAFAAVPQYLVHTAVELLPLTEPDKRLSQHPAPRPVIQRASARRHGFRCDADARGGPADVGQGLDKGRPRVRPPLALAVEPLEQDAFSTAKVRPAQPRVIRDGVVGQVADHAGAGQP